MGLAVRALGDIGDQSAIPALISALQYTVTRAEAAAALAKFGRPAVPFLVDRLQKERDHNILFHIREALGQLGWRPNRIQLNAER